MRLGGFWGFTAPMLVLAFPDGENVLPYFRVMAGNSNSESLRCLQKELLYLTKIRNLRIYKPAISVLEMVGDDYWTKDGFVQNTEYSSVFKTEVFQRALVKIYEREQRGAYKALDSLEECVNRILNEWNGKVSDVDKAVSRVVSKLPSATEACFDDWIATNGISLEYGLVDRIRINGQEHVLSEDEKSVCRYFLERIPDVEMWIQALYVDDVQDEELYGIPFSLLAKRKPESIRYAVMNQFDQIKSTNNEKILRDKVAKLRADTKKFRYSYNEFVSSDRNGEIIYEGDTVPMSKEAATFFSSLHGFSLDSLLPKDRVMLAELFERAKSVEAESLNKVLGIVCNDWNAFGMRLSEIGICGINAVQLELFREAIANTVLSFNKIYRDAGTIAKVNTILTYDVEAMLDTIISVGEVISE